MNAKLGDLKCREPHAWRPAGRVFGGSDPAGRWIEGLKNVLRKLTTDNCSFQRNDRIESEVRQLCVATREMLQNKRRNSVG